MANANLSQQDQQKREEILSGNLWLVLMRYGVPLALFQSLNQLFKILDSMIAASISPMSVSAVSYLSQISLMLSSVGGGLAVGASIRISEAYGQGDYELVHRRVSTLMAMCFGLGGLILLLVPFTETFLRMTGTPEAFIEEGTRYFAISLVDIVLLFVNTAYIAIERARGNANRILWLNLTAVGVKLGLTAYFVYVLHGDMTMIAVATVISNLVIFSACIWYLFLDRSGRVFHVSLSSVQWNKTVTTPMVETSIPVIAEKVLFQLGKVLVNGMTTMYGELTVGALGISNNLGGITTNPQNGFQEAGAAIISQNRGAGQTKRALNAFYRLCVINGMVGLVGYILTSVFMGPLTTLFSGGDAQFPELIARVYQYEAAALVPLGLLSAVTALLYGFSYTRLTLALNFSRVFVFRIPVLWALQQFTQLGAESVGIMMMISNISTGLMAVIIGVIVVYQIKRTEEKLC